MYIADARKSRLFRKATARDSTQQRRVLVLTHRNSCTEVESQMQAFAVLAFIDAVLEVVAGSLDHGFRYSA